MKRIIATLAFVLVALGASAQDVYWVFLADKAGTTFDPYTYFDAKAVERYQQCGADLYDISNYPVTPRYEAGVAALATEDLGSSRWLNAVGVSATPDQIASIAALPYVVRVQRLGGDMLPAMRSASDETLEETDTTLTDQLIRMQGHLFRQAGIDGRGVRIAVFDGGFPRVNTHQAFKHLRDDGRILKTWNFPNKKENVYGWNSHGTMTLSCIAGRMDGKDLGMATGAEFLLARTEVEPEPFKEEVWWQQAVEWADRYGANIISSSLGYGQDRYYTRDMDGQSYVAKAANMAARKGILVVCSAGNEADDGSWQYLVTPSDADSALCIGGIEHSLDEYRHINFASFGPSADGRQKPNLCAFAHTWAASSGSDNSYEMVYGTSFSCPLVAGFAACAWQASKGKTNMEMFDLLQRSADLYPYCDYAFGYGVPQASYFVGPKAAVEPTFRFERQSATSVSVIPLRADSNASVFYKDVLDDGSIFTYGQKSIDLFDPAMRLDFEGGRHLVVHYLGYTADYQFETPTEPDPDEWGNVTCADRKRKVMATSTLVRTPSTDIAREKNTVWEVYIALGVPVSFGGSEMSSRFWSPVWHLGGRWLHRISKSYGIGLGFDWTTSYFRYNGRRYNDLEHLIGADIMIDDMTDLSRRRAVLSEVGLELFQRVRLLPAGLLHKGLHWDLGVYASSGSSSYQLEGKLAVAAPYNKLSLNLEDLEPLDGYSLNYGVVTRLTYDAIGLYARYRLNGIGSEVPNGKVLLPRLDVGVQLLF